MTKNKSIQSLNVKSSGGGGGGGNLFTYSKHSIKFIRTTISPPKHQKQKKKQKRKATR
jgi:hypothetical protein